MSDISDLKHIAKLKLLLCDQIDKSNLRLLSYNEIMIVRAIADLCIKTILFFIKKVKEIVNYKCK